MFMFYFTLMTFEKPWFHMFSIPQLSVEQIGFFSFGKAKDLGKGN